MTRQELFEQIKAKRSFLCVGLDTDFRKIPEHVLERAKSNNVLDKPTAIFNFNKAVVDATAEFAVAYKPNLAFYEGGHEADFVATCEYLRANYPELLIIADAKRGDIGNTSTMYAKAFFDNDLADAVTLAPYMGRDTVEPFLAEKYDGKWAVVLALTSNPSADDFETLRLEGGEFLWQRVLRTAAGWGCEPHGRSNNLDRMMFVVGATRAEMLAEVREIVPDHFLLVPGVGAQGGSLEEVAKYGMNRECGLLVNSSRGIIYAGAKDPRWNTDQGYFAAAAAAEARKLAAEMGALLDKYL